MKNEITLTKEDKLENVSTAKAEFEFDFAMCHGSYYCC
jgi:hypothetical protein